MHGTGVGSTVAETKDDQGCDANGQSNWWLQLAWIPTVVARHRCSGALGPVPGDLKRPGDLGRSVPSDLERSVPRDLECSVLVLRRREDRHGLMVRGSSWTVRALSILIDCKSRFRLVQRETNCRIQGFRDNMMAHLCWTSEREGLLQFRMRDLKPAGLLDGLQPSVLVGKSSTDGTLVEYRRIAGMDLKAGVFQARLPLGC